MGTPEEMASATPTQVEGAMLVATEVRAIRAIPAAEAAGATADMVAEVAAGVVTLAETARVGE